MRTLLHRRAGTAAWPRGGLALFGLLPLAVALASGPEVSATPTDDPAPGGQATPAQAPAPPVTWQLLGKGLQSLRRLEFVEMFTAVLRGSNMGPGEGWFHPSQSRYGPSWLAVHFDADHSRSVTRKEFQGPDAFFERLDRDGDGVLTVDDFDWSDSSLFLRQASMVTRPFFFIDSNSNGRVSQEEWDAFFARMSKGKGHITPDDLRLALLPPRQRPEPGQQPPQDGPTPLTLIKGLLNGELGSMLEGPAIDQPAADFTLSTQDGKRRIALADYRGKKPVVLVFGSFT